VGYEELGAAAQEIEDRLRDGYRPETGDMKRFQAAMLPVESDRTAECRKAHAAAHRHPWSLPRLISGTGIVFVDRLIRQ
jgi:hypothetical protein